MMEIKINLNERVKFKLSERGKEIYRHRYDGYGFEYDREPKLDDDGYMSMQLWTFMQIFGEYMVMGMSEVLKPLEIIYESEALGDVESATTTDCISRMGTIKALCTECTCEDGCCAGCTEVKIVKSMPPVEPKRTKGEWVFNPKDAIDLMFTLPKCSECGFESADCGNFCSNCGADMRGDKG